MGGGFSKNLKMLRDALKLIKLYTICTISFIIIFIELHDLTTKCLHILISKNIEYFRK